MYLSRIAIDMKKHDSMRALFNLEKLHGMIECSFQGERKRNLWRLDKLRGEYYLLLLSATAPQNNSLPEQISYQDNYWETKCYDGLLERIKEGTNWTFRLTANPTVAQIQNIRRRGKVKAIINPIEQREWMKKQSLKKGFKLMDDRFDVMQSEWRAFKKNGRTVRVLAVTYEGILEVTDANLFRQTLIEGIGREKAYGMGLLTVMPHVP